MDKTLELIDAVKSGDEAKVEALLAEDAGLAATEADGVPLTLLAFYYGNGQIGTLIAQRKPDHSLFEAAALGEVDRIHAQAGGADLYAYSVDGFTALGFAAYFGQLEAVRALLELGANPNLASANPMGVAPLHSALSARNEAIVDLLLSKGANPNLASKEGWTPLHYSAHAGDFALTEKLLANGARPGLEKNSEGRDAAQMAHEQGADDVARLIESYYPG